MIESFCYPFLRKKWIILWLSILISPLYAQSDSLTVVFCNDGYTNPYHIEWLAGFEAALSAYNNKLGMIEGYWRGAGSVEEQITQVEDVINEGVDILFVNAINITAIRPLMEKARERGIIWISVHNPMEEADYNFLLTDFDNGYRQGLALATYLGGRGQVAVMLGTRGMASGENRLQGILAALEKFPDIEVVAQEPADWDTTKALRLSVKLFNQYPDLDALSVVTDSYLYPAIPIARDMGLDDLIFFGYDGDRAILKQMENDGPVKADILLSATREGWNFVHLAYKIHKGLPVKKDYYFYTPLVLSDEAYTTCLKNGFPADIEVYTVKQAMDLAETGSIEFGPDDFIMDE